jgi:hypothetical protein
MSDFIREVDEDYRRERLLRFLSRFSIPLVVLAVAIVVGAGIWRYMVDQNQISAEADNARYEKAELLAKQGKSEEAEKAFSAIGAGGPAGYAMLARMRAMSLLAQHDPEAAAKGYDQIANDETIAQSMRDTARARGAFVRVDIEDAKAFEQRYGRFSVPGFAFRNSMRELLAVSALKANDSATAGKYLDEILADPLAPGALRNRAEAFRALVVAGPATAMTGPAPPARIAPLAAAAPPAASAAPATPAPAPE